MNLHFSTSETLWLKILIFFMLLFVVVAIYKQSPQLASKDKEGFVSYASPLKTTDKYMLRRNQDVYDDFYADVYHEISTPTSLLKTEIDTIVQQTQPSKEASYILDVGAGTGEVINEWINRGYEQVYGIELSPTLIHKSSHPNQIVASDFMLRQSFERSTFSHILCLHSTLYEIEQKVAFFKNCYYWLKPGGYFVVHLVEKPRLNTTQPIKTKKTQIKGLDYKAELEPGVHSESCVLTEHMTDRTTKQQRTQERTMYTKELGEIINDAIYCGFIVKGKSAFTSPVPLAKKEYLYFFQK